MQPMRFPGMVLLWYSVLAVRVPHPREMIRAGYRRLLVRPGLLGGAAVAPVVGVGWLLWSKVPISKWARLSPVRWRSR